MLLKFSKISFVPFKDLVNSTLNYLNQRIHLRNLLCKGKSSSLHEKKTISKVIRIRSRLENKYKKNISEENKRNYTRQRNYCVKLLRKEKKNFFAKLDTKNIAHNKTFLQTVEPFFSPKLLMLIKFL